MHSVDVRISLTGDANMDLQPDSSFARMHDEANSSATKVAMDHDFAVPRTAQGQLFAFLIPLRVPMWRQVVSLQVRAVGVNTLPSG